MPFFERGRGNAYSCAEREVGAEMEADCVVG